MPRPLYSVGGAVVTRGTGKTLAALTKLYLVLDKYPGARGLLVRKTRYSLSESALVTWENSVLPLGINNPMVQGAARSHRQNYSFPNGSELVLGGLDKPGKILSAEYDIVICCQAEDMLESDIDAIAGCMRNNQVPYQQIICECNPSYNHHWLNVNKGGRFTRLKSSMKDNPIYWDRTKGAWTPLGDSYFTNFLSSLSGVARERYVEGRWANQEGLVYEEFDSSVHVMKSQPYGEDHPLRLKRFVGAIDWGYTAPFVAQVWGVDSDGRMYLLSEVHKTRLVMAEITERIQYLSKLYPVETWVCDNAEPDKIQDLVNAGIDAIPTKKKTIEHGIGLVKDRLKIQGDGKPRIFFFDNALREEDVALREAAKPVSVIQEMDAYVWDGDKGVPKDANNDSLDALRYAAEYLNVGEVYLADDDAYYNTGAYAGGMIESRSMWESI